MKYASAMKYGGELVDAQDCTYDSFKELVLLCPNCKEPVFLRTGGQRESVKGKAYQIGSHWCHFKGISAEQVAGCELRVNGYTEKDRAKIASQARGQRLKLLQRWFWQVYSESMPWPILRERMKDVEFVTAVRRVLEKFYQETVIDVFLSEDHRNKDSICQVTIEELAKDYLMDIESESLETLKKLARSPLHQTMCCEVVDFLKSRLNHNLAIDALTSGLVIFETGKKERPDIFPAKDADIIILSEVFKIIISIPWASEFQRLEAEAKQRRGAA